MRNILLSLKNKKEKKKKREKLKGIGTELEAGGKQNQGRDLNDFQQKGEK